MAAPQRRRAAGAVLPGTYRAARMSQGRARAPNALGAAGGAPPPRAIRRSPAGGRCRPRSACPARERPPSTRLGRRRPPPRRLRSAGETGSYLQLGPPRMPRLLAAPSDLGGKGGRISSVYSQLPPPTGALCRAGALRGLGPRTARLQGGRAGTAGRDCVASPELMEAVLVALKQLPQDELGGVRLVPLEQLLEIGVCGQRHASGQVGRKQTRNGGHTE